MSVQLFMQTFPLILISKVISLLSFAFSSAYTSQRDIHSNIVKSDLVLAPSIKQYMVRVLILIEN